VKAEFITSAARADQFPADGLPEIAFLGRSNVGKSSLLNCLVGSRGLAFTSSKPGCTQVINFYRVDDQFHFVDLPGYGYARVPIEIANRWKRLIEHYLLHRKALEMCFLLIDARRGWTDKDLELKNWLEVHHRRYLVIATKTDKLKTQKEQQHGIAAMRGKTDQNPFMFSAPQCRGVREIWQAIWKIKNNNR
jgi:GTP-binding protein